MEIKEILDGWNRGDGKPMKGSLIDWSAWESGDGYCAMCAQGQILHAVAGWEPQRLRDTAQADADMETARLLDISRAHAVLLRNINDSVDGAPSIVLTDPGKVLGDKWSKLLDFWWLFHGYTDDDWQKVAAAWAAAGAAAGDAAGAAARAAVWAAAWAPARAAARAAAGEIQGFELLGQRGRDVFFLPMFGIKSLDDIPPRPADYGNGLVPAGESA